MSALSALIDEVELELTDTGNATWSTTEITQHIRRALRQINQAVPRRAATNFVSVVDIREYSVAAVSAMSGYQDILEVWYPYDPAEPGDWPPTRVPFRITSQDTIYLECDDDPSGDATEQIRVFFTLPHTINGLDSASTTTLSAQMEALLVLGAAAFAVYRVGQLAIPAVTTSSWTPRQYRDWADTRYKQFTDGLRALAREKALYQDSRIALTGEV